MHSLYKERSSIQKDTVFRLSASPRSSYPSSFT